MMFKQLSALIFLGIVFFGCEKKKLCSADAQDENHGIIIEDLTMNFGLPLNGNDDQWVIRDAAQFDSLFNQLSTNNNIEKPDIDFEQHSLLGFLVTGSGCSRTFRREVQQRSSSQSYFFEITVRECGGCEPLEFRHNWVLVPKLPDDWEVEFSLVTTRH